MQRLNQRNQTVAVAGHQFSPLEQDERVLRKAERSTTLPSSATRRADNLDLNAEDRAKLDERQTALKGRQRRGSIFLAKVDEADLARFWEEKAGVELHVHGRLSGEASENSPGSEREAILYKLREAKALQEDYRFIYSCVKGAKGFNDTTPNQDNFSYTVFNGYEIVIVMDGHGPCGHRVSTRCVHSIPYYLCKSDKFTAGDIKGAIKESFAKASEDLLGYAIDEDVDVQASGSTCVLFLKKDDEYWTANVGDSRAVIGYEGEKEVVFETLDHKPSVEAEKARIEASGGEIRTLRYDDFSVDRIFVKDTDYPGLCMSRSFGDECVKACGVTSEPEISGPSKLDLDKKPFLVIASDGVWEFIESSWCVKAIVKKLSQEPPERIVQKLGKEARRRWKQEEGDYCDDVTVCLLQMGKK